MSENLPTTITAAPPATTMQSAFASPATFEAAQRMAMALCTSTLVPKEYQGKENLGNTLIALEMSQRVGASPMAVMQNLHVIHGRPSWSSSFIIAALNSCGKFSAIRFKVEGEGDNKTCMAWAYDKANGEVLDGPPSSIEMAKAEGWMTKNGSKWKTMPDLMLRYRAAAFFGRLYAPEILMGMQSADEVQDVGIDAPPTLVEPVAATPTIVYTPTPTEAAPTEPSENTTLERERGKPAPGKSKRTSKEVEEDRLADEAEAQTQQPETVEAELDGQEPPPLAEPSTPPPADNDFF